MSRLLRDPTRTGLIRQRFVRDMDSRFDKLSKLVSHVVVDEDWFGLDLVHNTRWAFISDSAKIKSFQDWLKGQVDDGLLEVDKQYKNEPWLADHVRAGYGRGEQDAYIAAQKAKKDDRLGPVDDFLRSAFKNQHSVNRISLLYTRAFEALKNVTAQMSQNMSRSLADSFAQGRGARDAGRRLKDAVGVSRSRARTIARTELIHSYAEGQLDGFEEAGVEGLTLLAEWTTMAGACPLCSALAGSVYTIQEARGLLPRHPNCRCAWRPAFDDIRQRGQTRSGSRLQAKLNKSVRKEKPSKTLREARRRSSWRGADVKPKGKIIPA